MTKLTAELLGETPRRSVWRERFVEVSKRLVSEYGRPSLGNFRDPSREIFFILLSARTTDVLYRRAHRELFRYFHTIGDLSEASEKEVLSCIGRAGLGRKRAKQVISTAIQLKSDFGMRPAFQLSKLSLQDAYNYLVSLPGLGPKSALCIMMYSLDFDVFPVDVNVQRVAERMGAISSGLKHYEAQRYLPSIVPCSIGQDLHVGLVAHGRKICLPHRMKCNSCILADMCRVGRRKVKERNGNR